MDSEGQGERIVGSVEDVIDADFGHEVAQSLLVKDHRVDVELVPEILAWLSLERLAVGAAGASTQRIRPPAVRRRVAAGVSRADLEPRVAIQRALEDQV